MKIQNFNADLTAIADNDEMASLIDLDAVVLSDLTSEAYIDEAEVDGDEAVFTVRAPLNVLDTSVDELAAEYAIWDALEKEGITLDKRFTNLNVRYVGGNKFDCSITTV